MTLDELNQLNQRAAFDAFYNCLSVNTYAKCMVSIRPFASSSAILEATDSFWRTASLEEKLEAFDGHPQIGDISTLKAKYQATASEAGHEQQSVNVASEETLIKLKTLNDQYLERFGFIFIVFATGKSAAQMLELLQSRIDKTREQEIQNAANEQLKITNLRIKKTLNDHEEKLP